MWAWDIHEKDKAASCPFVIFFFLLCILFFFSPRFLQCVRSPLSSILCSLTSFSFSSLLPVSSLRCPQHTTEPHRRQAQALLPTLALELDRNAGKWRAELPDPRRDQPCAKETVRLNLRNM